MPIYDPRSAEVYDLLHRNHSYDREVDYVRAVVAREMPQARSLLDIACGTGNHLGLLASHFEVQGLDLSPGMLARAQAKLPQLRFHEASMADFHLGQRFDVVTCLFRSIAAVSSVEALQASLRCIAAHLNPGGVVVVEPFFTPQTFWDQDLRMSQVEADGLKVVWMYRSERRGSVGVFHNHYLIGRPQGIEHVHEAHDLGLFEPGEIVHAFQAAGLSVRYDAQGIGPLGCYIGRAPLNDR